MSKILQLKQWLTLSEAATRLATLLDDEVSESDVLYLALDGKIKLSVDFVNGACAREGTVMSAEDAPRLPSLFGDHEVITGALMPDGRRLVMEKEIVDIRGVFDLPMVGGERLDVEFLYHEKMGGPTLTLSCIEGAFVTHGDTYFQLQEDPEKNEFIPGSRAYVAKMSSRASAELDPDAARAIALETEMLREEFKKSTRDRPRKDRYYPASGLPDDAILGISTKEILNFAHSLNDSSSRNHNTALSEGERNTLLKIVLGMAIGGYGFDPSAKKNATAKQVEDDTGRHSVRVTDDTVREYLKEAVSKFYSPSARQ